MGLVILFTVIYIVLVPTHDENGFLSGKDGRILCFYNFSLRKRFGLTCLPSVLLYGFLIDAAKQSMTLLFGTMDIPG